MPADAEGRAWERMEPGSNNPVYEKPGKDVTGGWRINTPPIEREREEEEEEE